MPENISLPAAARIVEQNLILEAADTGAAAKSLAESGKNGGGLNNIEQRLFSHFGKAARFEIKSEISVGTKSKIVLPIKNAKEVLTQAIQKTERNLTADERR